MTDHLDTRPLRRWLDAQDRRSLVLLPPGVTIPEAAAEDEAGTAPKPPRPGLTARLRGVFTGATGPPAVAVRLPAEPPLAGADVLTLLAHATRVDVVVPAGEETSIPGLATQVTRAAGLAAMCGLPGAVAPVPPSAAAGAQVVELDRVPLGRRALLGAPDRPVLADAPSPQRRLVDAVRTLLEAQGHTAAHIEEADEVPPTGTPRLRAKGCCGDGLCERVCPHDALHLERIELGDGDAGHAGATTPALPGGAARKPRQFRLVHSPVDCSACGLCVQMCPNQALGTVGEQTWTDLLADRSIPLRVGLERPCARCGAAHGHPGDLCPTCEARQRDPFSVRLPPGFPTPER